jgi:hypothetical protein
MHCFEAQPWTTIRMVKAATVVTQSEHQWLDLAEYRDVVIWIEVKEFSAGGGTLTFALETSPSKDDGLFTAIISTAAAVTVAAIPRHRDWATVPIARWLRWKLTVGGTVTSTPDITFRYWVAAVSGTGARRGWGMPRAG